MAGLRVRPGALLYSGGAYRLVRMPVCACYSTRLPARHGTIAPSPQVRVLSRRWARWLRRGLSGKLEGLKDMLFLLAFFLVSIGRSDPTSRKMPRT